MIDSLTEIANSIGFGIVVGILPICVTLIQKTYSTEISLAWPLGEWPGHNRRMAWAAILFWTCGTIWIICFVARELARNWQTKQLQTIPSGTYMGEYGEIISKIENRLVSVIPHSFAPEIKNNDAEFTAFVRELLRSVAKLAKLYDDRSDARYAANVMIYVPKESFTHSIRNMVKFCAFEKLESLKGALVLSSEFSSIANALEQYSEIDTQIEEIALPIREAPAPVLPGAPRAFLGVGDLSVSPRLQTHCVNDIQELELNDLGLDQGERNQFRHYYSETGPGRSVRSFMSFPLIGIRQERIGVLNIHCNKPGWVGGNKNRQSNSSILILPLANEISSVLDLWRSRAGA